MRASSRTSLRTKLSRKLSRRLTRHRVDADRFRQQLASGNKEIWAMDYDGANQHQL